MGVHAVPPAATALTKVLHLSFCSGLPRASLAIEHRRQPATPDCLKASAVLQVAADPHTPSAGCSPPLLSVQVSALLLFKQIMRLVDTPLLMSLPAPAGVASAAGVLAVQTPARVPSPPNTHLGNLLCSPTLTINLGTLFQHNDRALFIFGRIAQPPLLTVLNDSLYHPDMLLITSSAN